MTTLELAEQIALVVLNAMRLPGSQPYDTAPVQTMLVLQCLREHSSWFCRVSDPEDGLTVDTPYEQVQLELFMERTL